MRKHQRDPKVERLAAVPMLRGCSEGELERLAPLFDELDLRAGDVLMREGRSGSETFIILAGQVSVTSGGEQVAVLGPGDVVGELAVLTRGRRSATVTCDTPARAVVLSPRAFQALIAEPSIGGRVARTLAERMAPRHAGVTR